MLLGFAIDIQSTIAELSGFVKSFLGDLLASCLQCGFCRIISVVASGLEKASDFSSRLVGLLAEGEHERLEFKRAVPKNLADHIAGMANTAGGTILIGVTDEGEPVGVQASNRLLGQIQDMAGNCDPSVNARAFVLDNVIVVEVEESRQKPVQSKGGGSSSGWVLARER